MTKEEVIKDILWDESRIGNSISLRGTHSLSGTRSQEYSGKHSLRLRYKVLDDILLKLKVPDPDKKPKITITIEGDPTFDGYQNEIIYYDKGLPKLSEQYHTDTIRQAHEYATNHVKEYITFLMTQK